MRSEDRQTRLHRQDCQVRHPLDVLFHDIGVEAIKQKVVRPLKGLKVAPYYGCQVVRPYATFDRRLESHNHG